MTETRIATTPNDSTRAWGLGVRRHDVDGVRMQTHSGGTNGYISNFVRYPDHDACSSFSPIAGLLVPAGWPRRWRRR